MPSKKIFFHAFIYKILFVVIPCGYRNRRIEERERERREKKKGNKREGRRKREKKKEEEKAEIIADSDSFNPVSGIHKKET